MQLVLVGIFKLNLTNCCMLSFEGSDLPYDLNSLMHLRRIIFQAAQSFLVVKVSDDFQVFYYYSRNQSSSNYYCELFSPSFLLVFSCILLLLGTHIFIMVTSSRFTLLSLLNIPSLFLVIFFFCLMSFLSEVSLATPAFCGYNLHDVSFPIL